MRRGVIWFCRIILAAVFLAASLPKIAQPHEFALAVYRYQMLPYGLVNIMAVLLPWLELVAAVALLVPRLSDGASLILGALLLVFTTAIAINLFRGIDMACGCFTVDAGAESIGWWNVARNLALLGATWLAARRLSSGPLPPTAGSTPAA